MLEAKNLQFAYDKGPMMSFPDITCAAGEQWLLLGNSGSGKTTLLHLLGGLRKTTSGQITIDGQDLGKLSESALDKFRGQHIGIIFQQSHFIRALTVRENLRLSQKLANKKPDERQIGATLDRLGILDKADSKPHRLSVGEQQRASIARALVNQPMLILADEPTSALDDHHCTEVIQLIKEQAAAENITLLIVTHDTRLKEVFDRSITLQKQAV